LSEPRGDPAAFALSWSRLFERCAKLPPLVVPLAERRDAGPAVLAPGEPSSDPSSADGSGAYVDAALALGAALCALLAGGRRGGRRVRSALRLQRLRSDRRGVGRGLLRLRRVELEVRADAVAAAEAGERDARAEGLEAQVHAVRRGRELALDR